MLRLLGRLALGLVVTLAVVYLGDFAAWKLRGSPSGSVDVMNVVVAPLKGNKEEYYADGSATVTCSQSLFPWAGAGACWYVRRHRTIEER